MTFCSLTSKIIMCNAFHSSESGEQYKNERYKRYKTERTQVTTNPSHAI